MKADSKTALESIACAKVIMQDIIWLNVAGNTLFPRNSQRLLVRNLHRNRVALT